MEYKTYPNNFFELPDKLSNFKESKVVIIPVPYEQTTTGVQGTKHAPEFMREASICVQPYDEELEKDICDIGICTLKPVHQEKNQRKMMEKIQDTVKQVLNNNKFPITVGGEHSIAYGCISAAKEQYNNLSVLQFDAHTDLADEYDGTKYSHACAGKRAYDVTKQLVQIGIRSVCKEEAEFAKKNNIPIFWAHAIAEHDNWHDEVLSKLSDDVYLTLDLDGFDPSVIPHVGNPEPGGMRYYPSLRFFKKLFKEKNVVGMDIVELCPRKNDISYNSDFTAAKILYKLIGYKF